MSASYAAASMMGLRRSSRIAQMYDDNFSYCEKDDREFYDFDTDKSKSVTEYLVRRSARLAHKPRVDYSKVTLYPESLWNRQEFENSIVNQVERVLIQRNLGTSLRRSSRIAEKEEVDYRE